MIYILFFGVSGVVTKLLIQNKHPVCFSFFFLSKNSVRLSTFCLSECVTHIFELKVQQMSCAATESLFFSAIYLSAVLSHSLAEIHAAPSSNWLISAYPCVRLATVPRCEVGARSNSGGSCVQRES